ncbi:TRAF-type zinc finger domain-containing protein 1-like protein [Tanacetum coccineum]|uniref:TRAF-type zinc finger domain-containing protein 1-like protein n=1 Tax=Tanacetum coccineum TaxID=301880 RepID=A0ABQ4ZTD5_9ASTR
MVSKSISTIQNQLRTSSNSRTHATVHDGHIVTEPTQRKAPGNVGNTGARGKKVICYNCRGEGHVARQCKEQKRKMDSQYFKDKALLMEAKEKGDVLDAEAEAFLADVECTAPYDQPQALTTTNMFQANHEDAYDSDVDEGPNAAVAFMANLSSTSATNSQVNEVHSNDNPIFDNVDYQLNQEMHQEEHLDSDAETEIDDNTIPYHQYLLDTEAQNVPTEVSADTSDKVSMIAILTDLQTQLDGHAKVNQEKCLEVETLKNELSQCKQEIYRLDTQKVKLDLENKVRQEQALVIQRNKRNAELVQENDLLKSTLSGKEKSIAFLQSEKEKILSEKKDLADSYLDEIVCLKNANKVARDMLQRFNMPTQTIPMLSKKPKAATADLHKDLLGTRNPGLGYMAKRAQPVLYDADTLLHPTHHPVSIWDSEEVLVHQVVSMKKMNEKPGHINALMFVPQKDLSGDQAYWLSANEIASQASKSATPATLFVRKSRPPSQVLASLRNVNAVFPQFEGTHLKVVVTIRLSNTDRIQLKDTKLPPLGFSYNGLSLDRPNQTVKWTYVADLLVKIETTNRLQVQATDCMYHSVWVILRSFDAYCVRERDLMERGWGKDDRCSPQDDSSFDARHVLISDTTVSEVNLKKVLNKAFAQSLRINAACVASICSVKLQSDWKKRHSDSKLSNVCLVEKFRIRDPTQSMHPVFAVQLFLHFQPPLETCHSRIFSSSMPFLLFKPSWRGNLLSSQELTSSFPDFISLMASINICGNSINSFPSFVMWSSVKWEKSVSDDGLSRTQWLQIIIGGDDEDEYMSRNLKSKEATLQVVYDVLKLTPFYKAFQITADVLEIYMQEFWATATVHHHSIRFKMNNKKHIVNLEYFREMLQICPKLPNQQFEELPFEEAILTFLRDLGHSGEIKMITDVNVNKLHQPWRSFAAVINKCLSGKSTGYDSLRLSQAQIL